MNILENISLLPYNTFGIDVKTRFFIEYDSVEDLQETLQLPIMHTHNILAVGEGSNLLFQNDFQGVILHSAIRTIQIIKEDKENVYIEAGSGVNWNQLVAYCVERNWYGIENLSLIPGETGAAAVQNIGAYGTEIKDVIHEVKAIDINTALPVCFSNQACEYAYRDSIFKNRCKGRYIVTSVVLRLKKTETYNFSYQHLEDAVRKQGEVSLQNVRNTIIAIREEKLPDPKIQGNAGSFFKNPVISKQHFSLLQEQYPAMPHYYVSETKEKLSAAWLIDQCGWKGKALGKAGVHNKQPLVLVNLGNASATEIVSLAERIQESVKEKFSVELTPEVNYI